MARKTFACALALGTLLALAPSAAAQQTLNLTIGGFTPTGEDARVSGDVLNANRNFLVFDVRDFNGPAVGGEWLVPVAGFFEAGAGLSFSRRTVPSVYADFVDRDGSEIEQALRLRLVPLALTFRIVPLGQSSPAQPYFGAGVVLIGWRYSESGEFIEFPSRIIFRDHFVASGSAAGPVVLGGIRFAGDTLSAGGEIRYHRAEADLSSDFAGPKIDLGGWGYLATIGIRFGR